MKARPTIVDIAKRLGISDTTVSRALRHDPRISSETRNRVLAMAEQVGYVPNALARGLSRGETRTVGIVLPEMVTSLHFPRLVSAIEHALLQRGYVSYLCCNNGNPEMEANALRTLRQKQVDGIILVPVEGERTNGQLVQSLIDAHIPVVFADRYIPGPNTVCVTTDNRAGAYALTEHLLQLGHRRIAFLQLQVVSSALSDRFQGYLEALQGYDINADTNLVPRCTPTEEAVRGAVRTLLNISDPPTALFTPNEGVLIDTLFELRELGIRVPENLSVAAFDHPYRAVSLFCRVSYVDQPIESLGEHCVLELAALMNRGESGRDDQPKMVFLQPQLCIEESIAPPSQRHEHPA